MSVLKQHGGQRHLDQPLCRILTKMADALFSTS
jgi:hypothetical protein